MTTAPPVIIVMLRQPRQDDPRTDPLFELGSFGLTGCHHANLLADQAADGARLAFAQGGPLGVRLVMLTPPVEIRAFEDRHEARWSPAEMPLRYDGAPLLIAGDGASEIPGVREAIAAVRRDTWVARFASAFRSRKRPLDADLARAVVRAWARASAQPGARATAYWEALPRRPDRIEDRAAAHQRLVERALGQGPTRSC